MIRFSEASAFIGRMLATGGDKRIKIPTGASTNMYGASPFPREVLAYAATTANDISLEAFDHLQRVVGAWPSGAMGGSEYASSLEHLRDKLRRSFALDTGTPIVFAPSGTDLEFVALHLAAATAGKPVTNILLGADEVGSGCGLAAQGRYFSGETVLAEKVLQGTEVEGLGGAIMVDVPVRDGNGKPRGSLAIADDIQRLASEALKSGRHPLVHTIHGSKTGLVLPEISHIEMLQTRFGSDITLVVDACQARITGEEIRSYLRRGAILLLTGSKFMGGPPFSGFALLPVAMRGCAALPRGFETLFRKAEWPENWPGADELDGGSNPGLLLRLEAALFELERFEALPPESVEEISGAFARATRALADRLGVGYICPSRGASLSATMATLDLSLLPCAPDLETAQRWQRVLAARGIRLGQPVKCVKLPDGRWGGTLRISLSMPMIVSLAAHSRDEAERRLARDMGNIAGILEAALKPIAA